MRVGSNANALVAQGIQFTVLAHAFPVLRHDALKPISNAKLAAAMMQKTSTDSEAHSESRTQQLLADIDYMLDEGVDTVRLLAEWLTDGGKRIRLDDLLQQCIKLLFAHLLLSGKKISVTGGRHRAEVALYSGRYVVLAWLLHIVQTMADGSELAIECADGVRVSGHVYPGRGGSPLRSTGTDAAPPVPWSSVHDLAAFHGWSAGQGDSQWTLDRPERN
jgi:hypothetical protein